MRADSGRLRHPLRRHALLLLGLLFAACGTEDSVLARVGDTEITEAQLERFAELLPAHLQSKKEGVAVDREYLDSMVDREMLLLEARARGLDTDATVIRQLEAAQRQHLSQRYQWEIIGPKVQIGPKEIERGFHDMGFDRERLLSRILIKGGERDAQAVFDQLKAGRAFTDAVREYAGNDPTTDETGKVGWIGLTGLKGFKIQQPEFTSLAIGEPMLHRQAPGVWQISRFDEDREAQLQTYRDEIVKLLTTEQWWRRTEEEIEVLRQTYGTRYHPEAVQTLIQRVEERRSELTEEQGMQPLYTFADGDTITAADFLTRIREVKGTAAVTDSALIVDMLAEKELLHPYLFNREGRERGWLEEEDFITWRAHTFSGLLLDQLMQAEVEDRVDLSEDNLRAYYVDNREDFRVGETVRIEELHVKDEATARQLRDEVSAGASFAEILGRPGMASFGKHKRGGTMILQSHLDEAFPELFESAFTAPVGELLGPVYVEAADSYAIIRVIVRQESRIKPFDEAKKSIEYLSRTEQSNKLVEAIMASVKDKYQDRIQIFDDRLEQRQRDQ